MNIIDILVLLVLAFSLFAGMYKGFIASFLSLGGLVGSVFGALRLYPFLANLALGNQTLMGVLSTYLEPASFFEKISETVSGVSAQTAVSELVSRGAEAVNGVADFIGAKIPFIRDAFAQNLSSEAFAGLNLTTVADYFDQTLWQSIFNVLAFVAAFALLYFVITLVINLLNHVIRFPLIRKVDWLLGGLFGVARGIVIATLIIAVAEPALSAFSIDLMNTLKDGSKTYAMFAGKNSFDFLQIQDKINQIVLTASSTLR